MPRPDRRWWMVLVVGAGVGSAAADEPPAAPNQTPVPQSLQTVSPAPPIPVTSPAPAACDKPLAINLPTALQLAQVRPLDVALASQRIRLAAATLERARVLWLPTLQFGTDYFRHDGRIQDVGGSLFDTSKSSFMAGAAPIIIFSARPRVLGGGLDILGKT
jgi:outer membrane protein TolC